MALLTWLAVNVAVYIFSTAVPALIHLPMFVTFMLVNALVVASLTWVLMPLLTRWFNNWLQPAGQ
jgi:antibiotic biosynthesis monooxygenase (ABM) superfamily enzyme